MNIIDYEFAFDDINDGYSKVNLAKKSESDPISFDVSVGDSSIRLLKGNNLSSLQADLLDLAIAINFVDKLSLPKKLRSIHVHVSLPLRHPEIFELNSKMLQDLLYWYTEDYWSFHFQSRKSLPRESECSSSKNFDFYDFPEIVEFALWSGGLDSLAGLQTRLVDDKKKNFVLIGTGSNSIMRKTQQQVFHALSSFPHASGRLRFLHIPIEANYGDRYPHNQSHRARGIVFLLIGALSALSAGYKQLNVHETGIGAINLPLPGGVGRDHSKAVHPISLIKMEKFISNVIEEEFVICNPFLFSTKAEMCRSLEGYSYPTFETISCDRLHREKYIQCGYCSSCILRRQALASAGIKDQTKYVIPHGKRAESKHLAYWNLMNQQIVVLEKALDSSDPYDNLCMAYINDIPDIVSDVADNAVHDEGVLKERLIQLYKKYVQEWQNVAEILFSEMTLNIKDSYFLEDGKWQQMHLIN
ncbi:MAG: 7-cyano-7-deazaguanine synthase [Anaerolineae bacterium]|nr:7-cyano-7-deazaguanine synthase [Anaerolineae bacterium]